MSTADITRRSFLVARKSLPRGIVARPPGAVDLHSCTGCKACVEACPAAIVSLKDGLPFLDFAGGECTFCGKCAAVCPEPVFVSEVPRRLVSAVSIGPSCFTQNGIACQSCRDACPEEAIRFRPRIGGPFLPELDEAACSGCGGCISVCPAGAIIVAERSKEVEHA